VTRKEEQTREERKMNIDIGGIEKREGNTRFYTDEGRDKKEET
jgi:hypothetical protein